MAKQRNITELVAYLKQTRNLFVKGYGLALIEMTQNVEGLAKRNVTQQFTGRNGRTLTGRLLNSVFSGFEKQGSGLPIGFVGVRGIPYGAIHEYGGVITPKKAKNLWLKNHRAPAKFKRLTPREFVERMQKNSANRTHGQETYNIIPGKNGPTAVVQKNFKTADSGLSAKSLDNKIIPLFFLRKKVTIPERPYLRPAIKEGVSGFHKGINKHVFNILFRGR